jgi:hypothetical protein
VFVRWLGAKEILEIGALNALARRREGCRIVDHEGCERFESFRPRRRVSESVKNRCELHPFPFGFAQNQVKRPNV